ncbi:MAG: hypothetical protein M3N28_00720 [Actinomycetota bacterium]|nr:hypothetical protein [Actinomycetota bacterium]
MPVGVGLLVLGVTTYGFLTVTARAVGPDGYATLFSLWALVLLVGAGFFFPVEQELARTISSRGTGSSALVRSGALLAASISLILIVGVILASPFLMSRLFDHQWLLLVGLGLSVAGAGSQFLVRGALLGNKRFEDYGLLLAAEGLSRLVGCLVLYWAGVERPGPYGLVIGLAPWLSSLIGLRSARIILTDGPAVSKAKVFTAVGVLMVGSLFTQALLNIGPVLIKLLASDVERSDASRFLAGFVLARLPLFLFLAILASALPRLSALAGAGDRLGFEAAVKQLTAAVGALGLVGLVLVTVFGPSVVRIMYGADFTIGRSHLLYLAAAGAAQMLALTLGAAVIARSDELRAAAGWVLGLAVLGAVVAAEAGTLERVERGLLAGSVAAFLVMALVLIARRHQWEEGGVSPDEELMAPPPVEF